MLFLFRGHNGALVRAIVGAVLTATGLALHGGRILVAMGIVLIIWGAAAAFSAHRSRRRISFESTVRTS